MTPATPSQPTHWHLITGEYPPQPGGVSDYSFQLARALVTAGDQVHVWAPAAQAPADLDDDVRVHRLSGRFGAGSLGELGAGIDRFPPPRRLLVQYVAGAFGYHAMNLPFCLWLYRRRTDPVWVMFHEYAYPLGWRLKPAHNLLGIVTPIMAGLLASRADRIFVSTPAWERRMPAFVRRSKTSTWLPVPTNIPEQVGDEAVATARMRVTGGRPATLIGHFGTYGSLIAGLLSEILPALLRIDPSRIALLAGRGSEQFARRLARGDGRIQRQIVATGGLPGEDLAAHLRACDILVQPYEDGATSRRSSLMAGLALGLPIVTNEGEATEPAWRGMGAVVLASSPSSPAIITAAEELLSSPGRWGELGVRAAAVYAKEFSLERSVRTLRALAEQDRARGR